MTENKAPFRVYCRNCGAPAGFDIIRQTYRCASCGELTGISEAKEQAYHWKLLRKEDRSARTEGQAVEAYACPSCGAQIVFGPGEASETCDFCGSRLVRKELASDAQMPDMIIPFFITPEEARERLLAWGRKNEKQPEGKSVIAGIDALRGCYLPYQLVRGPVEATVARDASARRYLCRGFLEGTAVNTSRQLDNQVLNDMEPFDWSAARPFEYGLIAGSGVKLSDVSDAETERRVREEVTQDFLPEVEKVMQTTGVSIDVKTGELLTINALLPVYFIRSGDLLAAMNGQTGRIAVSRARKKKTFPWVIEPILYTLILTFLLGLWSHFSAEVMLYCGLVVALIIFAVMGDGRTSLIRRITLRTRAGRAKREDAVLVIDDSKDILKNPYDNTPVFYEPDGQGDSVPVRIRFYTVGRWLTVVLNAFVTVFLPAILAAVFRLVTMGRGARFLDGFRPLYGAAWYVLAALIVLVYFIKGVRKDVYDHPYLYEILPDGGSRLMGVRRDRRVTVLSMFGIGQPDREGKRVTVFRFFRLLGGPGVFLAVALLGILIGSVAAILL